MEMSVTHYRSWQSVVYVPDLEEVGSWMEVSITDCQFLQCVMHVPDFEDYDGPVSSLRIHGETFVNKEFCSEDFMRALHGFDGPEARLGPCIQCKRLAAYGASGTAQCTDEDLCAVAHVLES